MHSKHPSLGRRAATRATNCAWSRRRPTWPLDERGCYMEKYPTAALSGGELCLDRRGFGSGSRTPILFVVVRHSVELGAPGVGPPDPYVLPNTTTIVFGKTYRPRFSPLTDATAS